VGSILRLTVSDTGKGISAEYLPRVFEQFSQEDATSTRSHEGIGLGLSIARSLVELHGGWIRVASDGEGCGATFTVGFPLLSETTANRIAKNSDATAGPTDSPELEMPRLDGTAILVIDDQDTMRNVVKAILGRTGATVHVASSVREGLALFETVTPDVVVCDLAMPGADGFSFVKTIRTLSGPPRHTPVIALTAFGRPQDRTHALAAGFDGYMKKPVDPVELAMEVKRLLA
jgi:CheY-like chemotaxis protein